MPVMKFSTEAQRMAILEALDTLDKEKLVRDPLVEQPLNDLKVILEKNGAQVADPGEVPNPSLKNLTLWAFLHGTPFIAFGFFDNALMLLAGDYIDSQLGVTLGVSTMAACAFGNIIGDVFGLFAANPVEVGVVFMATKLHLPQPQLSTPQKFLFVSRLWKTMGCVGGVIIGCTLGMFPLLWPVEWRLWASKNMLKRDE